MTAHIFLFFARLRDSEIPTKRVTPPCANKTSTHFLYLLSYTNLIAFYEVDIGGYSLIQLLHIRLIALLLYHLHCGLLKVSHSFNSPHL